jgi:hypothetical protein
MEVGDLAWWLLIRFLINSDRISASRAVCGVLETRGWAKCVAEDLAVLGSDTLR